MLCWFDCAGSSHRWNAATAAGACGSRFSRPERPMKSVVLTIHCWKTARKATRMWLKTINACWSVVHISRSVYVSRLVVCSASGFSRSWTLCFYCQLTQRSPIIVTFIKEGSKRNETRVVWRIFPGSSPRTLSTWEKILHIYNWAWQLIPKIRHYDTPLITFLLTNF